MKIRRPLKGKKETNDRLLSNRSAIIISCLRLAFGYSYSALTEKVIGGGIELVPAVMRRAFSQKAVFASTNIVAGWCSSLRGIAAVFAIVMGPGCLRYFSIRVVGSILPHTPFAS
ncbi:hypothetical protein AB6A40_000867 [Gnathostoma spinigerum]|uniref:Uncharacterized protein n=1 Tax=Gnathostoma spinigerum TaxID=75299 RepID=A0ABD6EBJ6_9BILA